MSGLFDKERDAEINRDQRPDLYPVRSQPEWIPVTSVIKILKSLKTKGWCWSRNSKCKYIEIRIDMRDQNCILKDRDGNFITLKQLEEQFGA